MKDTIIKYFGTELTEKQTQQFSAMYDIYEAWNNKINVVSRKDFANLYLKHILHSLAIAKVHQFKAGDVIMDIGCGGGFPGIPLAVLYPESKFIMVDSIAKKITVVTNVAQELGLTNVTTHNCRAEDLGVKVDYIVSRAVTDLTTFLGWSWKQLKKGGDHSILYLKGGDLAEEIAGGKRFIGGGGIVVEHSIPAFFEEEFFETKKVLQILKR